MVVTACTVELPKTSKISIKVLDVLGSFNFNRIVQIFNKNRKKNRFFSRVITLCVTEIERNRLEVRASTTPFTCRNQNLGFGVVLFEKIKMLEKTVKKSKFCFSVNHIFL